MKNFLFLLVLLLLGCNDNPNTVVVYTTVDQVFSEPIFKKLEKDINITIKPIYDTEETKSTGVLNRLIAEKDNPQCDVFWSGDPARTAVLKQKGITDSYKSPSRVGIDPIFIDPDVQWIGFSARARVLIYNKNTVKDLKVPTSIFDLTKPEYKGKITIANPLFGTTTFHIAALFSVIGDKKAIQFLDDLKSNDVIIATSNGDVLKRVLQGEAIFGLTDTDDAYEAQKNEDPIGIVMLDQDGIGNLIMPNTVNMIKNAKHLRVGRMLIDYLISPEFEALLAKSCAQMPLHKGVKVPDNMPSLDHIVPMKVDYGKVAKKLEEIQPILKKWAEQ